VEAATSNAPVGGNPPSQGRFESHSGWVSTRCLPRNRDRPAPPQVKKADLMEYPEVFDQVGLLVNEPPGKAGLPFI